MEQSDLLAIIDLADELGLTMFISGGWGVDALVSHQTRDHADLDVSLIAKEAEQLEAALEERGFELVVDWSPGRRAWRHQDGREVDVHPLEADADGTYRLVTKEGVQYVMPPGSYGPGTVAGRTVQCLSTAKQLEFHEGYEPVEDDLHDIGLLRRLTADDPPQGASPIDSPSS